MSTTRPDLLDPATARAVVAAWVGDRGGGVATEMRTRQVLKVGRRSVVRWRVVTDRATHDLVAMSEPLSGPHMTSLTVDGAAIGVFELPHDPALPGLALLNGPAWVARLLGRPVRSVQRRRYRPLTRAVVEVVLNDGSRAWAKVVRPAAADAVLSVHQQCASVVDGPTVLQARPELGVVVLAHVTGEDLRARLRREGAVLPSVDQVVELPTRLAAVTSARPVRRSPPLDGVSRNVTRLRDVVPTSHHAQMDRLAATLDLVPRVAASAPGPTIHGDLHSAQVMVGDRGVTGLVDLDDAGAGDPADDLARFVAHLVSTTDRANAQWAQPWSRDLIAAVRHLVPDEVLQPRVAAQLVSLALGPHRVYRSGWEARTLRRIELAEHWSLPSGVQNPWA